MVALESWCKVWCRLSKKQEKNSLSASFADELFGICYKKKILLKTVALFTTEWRHYFENLPFTTYSSRETISSEAIFPALLKHKKYIKASGISICECFTCKGRIDNTHHKSITVEVSAEVNCKTKEIINSGTY